MVKEFALPCSADVAPKRSWMGITILAVLMCGMCWFEWYMSIHHHWAAIPNHVAAVSFLILFPFPCVSLFVKRLFKLQGFTPVTALHTYIVLLLAHSLSVPFR
jgi:hypothetical protein